MITAVVRTKLLTTTAVTNLVSTRIYVDELPDPATLPAITIHPISGVPDKEVGKKGFARVQVSIWAVTGNPKNPSVVESIRAAVKTVFHIPRMNMAYPMRLQAGTTSTYYDVTSSTCTGGVRLIDPTTGWYHVPMDIELTYNEV